MKKLLVMVVMVMVLMTGCGNNTTSYRDYNEELVTQYCNVKGYTLISEVEVTSDNNGLWLEYRCKDNDDGHTHSMKTKYTYVKQVVENHKNVYLKLD